MSLHDFILYIMIIIILYKTRTEYKDAISGLKFLNKILGNSVDNLNEKIYTLEDEIFQLKKKLSDQDMVAQ